MSSSIRASNKPNGAYSAKFEWTRMALRTSGLSPVPMLILSFLRRRNVRTLSHTNNKAEKAAYMGVTSSAIM